MSRSGPPPVDRRPRRRPRAAADRSRTATADEESARELLQQACQLRDAQQRHADALAERDRLALAAPDHARQVDRLARARRAAEVAPLGRIADQQAHAADRARELSVTRTEAAAARLGVDSASLDEARLLRLRDQAVATAADARALLPRESALAVLRTEVDEASARERRLAAEHDELQQLLADLPDEIAALQERESEARDAERDQPGVRDKVVSLRSRCEAAAQAVRLAEELTEAADLHRQAVDEAQQLRESWLQIQEERIRGIAAELAGALVVGGQCPVCGSADHPRPASPDAGAPDATTEKAARKQVDDAEAARHAHDVRVRELTGRLEAARSTADGDLASCARSSPPWSPSCGDSRRWPTPSRSVTHRSSPQRLGTPSSPHVARRSPGTWPSRPRTWPAGGRSA